jgi:putative transposase
VIETIRRGLEADGVRVSTSKLCKWVKVPRRTAYCKPTKAAPNIKPELAKPIEALI